MIVITSGNDTLASLALKYTNDAMNAGIISTANGMSNEYYSTPIDVPLEPGLEINIPDWIVPASMLQRFTAVNTAIPSTAINSPGTSYVVTSPQSPTLIPGIAQKTLYIALVGLMVLALMTRA